MSKKRFIWQRSLSAGLSVLLCLSMLPVAALAEEPDGSEDALRNTAVEKADTEIIGNTTDNDAVVEDAIVENAVIENDAVESSDDADADAQDIDVQDIDADAVNVQVAAAEHAHPICGRGDACTDPNHASHEVITDWKPISSESELSKTTANGHYYLTADVVIDEYWRCHNSIVLCLNGHTITFLEAKDSTSNGGVTITSDTTFTLCDCSKDQTGKITGSTRSGVNVSGSTAIFNMYGGKITGNCNNAGTDSAYGGGVRVRRKGTFNMYGGEISGNQSISSWYAYGGGVCVEDEGSIFNMYGGKITGNTAKNGNDVALYWYGRMCLSGAPILGDIYLVQLNNGGIDVGEGGLAENTTYQINFAGMEASSMVFRCIGTMSKEDAGHFPAPSGAEYDQGDPWSAWYNGEQLIFVRKSAKHLGGIHPICGDGAACTAPDHAENHENIAWTPTDHIPTYIYGRENRLEPGNYYLTKDTTIDSSRWLVVTGDVKICLNGHTIKYEPWKDGEAGSYCIKLEEGASVSICDCSKGQTGKIIKTTEIDYQDYYSTLFRCLRNSTLNLFGGEISGGGSSQGRQAPGGGRGPVPAQQGAEIYAGIRRGIEFPPQPSPAQGLAGRHQHGALRGPLVGPGFQQGVGGGHLIQHLDLPDFPAIQAAFDTSQAQDIPAGQQPIAPAGLALNGIAPGPQGGNGLPHRRPGQIQALRQLLAGEIGPPAGAQKGQDPVFGCHGVHLAV